jgi:hypothetical protein
MMKARLSRVYLTVQQAVETYGGVEVVSRILFDPEILWR